MPLLRPELQLIALCLPRIRDAARQSELIRCRVILYNANLHVLQLQLHLIPGMKEAVGFRTQMLRFYSVFTNGVREESALYAGVPLIRGPHQAKLAGGGKERLHIANARSITVFVKTLERMSNGGRMWLGN